MYVQLTHHVVPALHRQSCSKRLCSNDAIQLLSGQAQVMDMQGFLSLPYIASLVVEMENLKAREEHQQENHRIKAKQISDLEEAIKSQRADCVAYARHRSIMEQALKVSCPECHSICQRLTICLRRCESQ